MTIARITPALRGLAAPSWLGAGPRLPQSRSPTRIRTSQPGGSGGAPGGQDP